MVIKTFIDSDNEQQYSLLVSDVDLETAEKIKEFANSLGNVGNEAHDDDTYEDTPQVGELNVIADGPYANMTIDEAFCKDGYNALASLMRLDGFRGTRKFVSLVKLQEELYTYLLLKINNGEYKDQTEMSFLSKDTSAKGIMEGITKEASFWYDAEGDRLFASPKVENSLSPEFNGLTVIEIHEKFGLKGIAELLRQGNRLSNSAEYTKRYCKFLLAKADALVEADEFISAFAVFFRGVKLEEVLSLSEEEKENFLREKSSELIRRMEAPKLRAS